MIRRRFELHGVVQGVGFRPQVARVAARFPITGFCGNDDLEVFIEAQGSGEAVGSFIDAVLAELPPLAKIINIVETGVEPIPTELAFSIVASQHLPGAITLISPDIAICADCLFELNDPSDRRYRYPFITCTNCGPRLSIIKDVPYDRPFTTMAEFSMCAACRTEYENPADRRYHAQPISCFDCGPSLWLEISRETWHPCLSDFELKDPHPSEMARIVGWDEPIVAARKIISEGGILAVKGIGGFTLMCDARNSIAVQTLRERKRRPGKPLAVMAGSVQAAQQIAQLGEAHLRELTGPQRPIVLSPLGTSYDLATEVAPGLDDIGVMLPYSPLHQLLLDATDIWVATSANSSSKPLTYTNTDARKDLRQIVDAFVMHNRDIHVPVEDSVVMTVHNELAPVRRSRGYAPLPVKLGDQDCAVLAVGGELKNTFALTRDGMAFLSPHIGDMGSLETQAAFERSVTQLLTAHRRSPGLIVVDKHLGYATRAWGLRRAEASGANVLEVQHHHAHALSLLAEQSDCKVQTGRFLPPLVNPNSERSWAAAVKTSHSEPTQPDRLESPASNKLSTFLVIDGTGYGDDQTIWGGEILTLAEGNPLEYSREWHLPGFWLPGGDSAIRKPWKSAVALLYELNIASTGLPPGLLSPVEENALVRSQLENQFQVVRTTSTGRLFDAVSSILGVCQSVSYEAQAAMELEAVARKCQHQEHVVVRFHAELVDTKVHLRELITYLIAGLKNGEPVACLARIFHASLATLFAQAVSSIAQPFSAIGLTGGVCANRLLTAGIVEELTALGFHPITHRIVPANDGGLALGQALAGYLSLTKGSSA